MTASLEEISEKFGVPLLVTYSTIAVILATVYVSYINAKKHRYWKNQGINGPKPRPFVGNFFDMFSGPLLKRLTDRQKEFGSVYGTFLGLQPQIVISDPEMIKDIFIRDWHVFADRTGGIKSGNPIVDNFLTALSGNDWKRMRSVMSPTFTSGKMKIMFKIMNDCCKLMINNIRKRIDINKDKLFELDIRHMAGCYSMDVIAKCCFATETNSFDDPNHVFVSYCKKFFQIPKSRLIFSFLTPNWLRKFLRITIFSSDSVEFLEHVSRTLLEQRTNKNYNSSKKNDYLQLLIDASNGEQIKGHDNVKDNESHHGYEDKLSDKVINESNDNELKKALSVDEIISNSVLFLAVGYDTTSSLITMTVYSLACNIDVQKRLYEEIREAHERNGNKFDYELISGLKYLDAVISETLRILPPAPTIQRKSTEEYTFKDKNIHIDKGTSVIVPIWSMHHDDKYFEEPEKFIPERFLPENRDKLVPYTYIPFGGGPRNCVGMRFALLEAKLAICHLIMNFTFKPCNQTDIPLDLTKTLILMNPKRVIIGVQSRE